MISRFGLILAISESSAAIASEKSLCRGRTLGEVPVIGRRPYSTGLGPGKGGPPRNSEGFSRSLGEADAPPSLRPIIGIWPRRDARARAAGHIDAGSPADVRRR